MATFVELTEEDSTYHLVILLQQKGVPTAEPEEKQAGEPKAEKEGSETKEEDIDPALKEAKESPLGKLVEKRDYVGVLNGPGGFFANVSKIMASDADTIDAAFTFAFSAWKKSEAVRADQAKKRAEDQNTSIKAQKRKKKSEQELNAAKDAWTKQEAEKVKAEEQTRDAIIKHFIEVITDDEKSNRGLRIHLLQWVEHLVEDIPYLRYAVFLAVVKYARATDQLSLLEGQFQALDSWIQQWKLTSQQAAELYLLVSEVVPEDKRQVYILEFLKHMEECQGPERSSSQTKSTAAKACVAALQAYRFPEQPVYDCYLLLQYKLIQELRQDPKYGPLVELVDIFANKTITEYFEFAKVPANTKCLAEHGLSNDDVCQTLRTLTLCSLGLENERLSFDDLKQKLQLSEDLELESAVIEAVMTNRLQARIDQEMREVLVHRSTPRMFQDKDWAPLAAKMEMWSEKIAHVLANMRNVPERVFQG